MSKILKKIRAGVRSLLRDFKFQSDENLTGKLVY